MGVDKEKISFLANNPESLNRIRSLGSSSSKGRISPDADRKTRQCIMQLKTNKPFSSIYETPLSSHRVFRKMNLDFSPSNVKGPNINRKHMSSQNLRLNLNAKSKDSGSRPGTGRNRNGGPATLSINKTSSVKNIASLSLMPKITLSSHAYGVKVPHVQTSRSGKCYQ